MVLGRYFFPNSARCVAARATLDTARMLTISGEDGAPLAAIAFAKVNITPRLGSLPRRLMLPDGAAFETLDNDGIDTMIGVRRHLVRGGWMDRLERSWKAILISVLLAIIAGAAFVEWGIPAVAGSLARHTPPVVAETLSQQTLQMLDGRKLGPTTLTPADQAKAKALFAKVAATGACGAHDCRLELRRGLSIGANAFALPDGRIVLTDELWALVRRNDEIEGVFAHEMAHVRLAHGLTRVYEMSMVPAAIVMITGDVSQLSQIAVLLSAVLLHSSYSRDAEHEADLASIATLKQMHGRPAAMADLLARLERERCKQQDCGPNWLGDHPDTAARTATFRNGR
jgi:Zn-dependent protease with chaperone function